MSMLSLTYYYRFIGHAGASFANLVQTWKYIEDWLKTGNLRTTESFLNSYQTAREDRKRNFSNQRNEKNEKEVHVISAPTPQYQQPYALMYRNMYPPPLVYHPQQQYPTNRLETNQRQTPTGQPLMEFKQSCQKLHPSVRTIVRSIPEFVEHQTYNLDPAEPSASPLPKNHDQSVRCASHIDALRHDMNSCWAFKHKVQDLIYSRVIAITPQPKGSLICFHIIKQAPPRDHPSSLCYLLASIHLLNCFKSSPFGASLCLFRWVSLLLESCMSHILDPFVVYQRIVLNCKSFLYFSTNLNYTSVIPT